MNKDIETVDQYILAFPATVKTRLEKIRAIVLKYAPEAIEDLAYGMPAYELHKKPLVYFGGFSKHIGFYATPIAQEKFKQELSIYKQGKGSVRFPHDQELPEELISKMVLFKVADHKNPATFKKIL